MALPNPGMVFTPFDPLPASDLNDIVENVEALAAGTGLNDASVTAEKIDTGAITLGYVDKTSNFTTSASSATLITDMSLTVTIPTGGRRVKITVSGFNMYASNAGAYAQLNVWEGTVGSGTRVASTQISAAAPSQSLPVTAIGSYIPTAGSKTYNVSLHRAAGSGTATVEATATSPLFLLVELG